MSLTKRINSRNDMKSLIEKIEEKPLNLADFLSFDKSKTTQSDKGKENIVYSLISHISSRKKPDIYLGKEVILAKYYKLKEGKDEEDIYQKSNQEIQKQAEDSDANELIITKPEKKEILLKEEKKSPEETDHSSEIDNEYADKMKKKETRYFNISANITTKCYNCDEVGHISRNCPNEIRLICNRCNLAGHIADDCRTEKCYRCNRTGHKRNECTEKNIIFCKQCNRTGHYEEDCLLSTKGKSSKKHKCPFCDGNHLTCTPLTKNKEDIISDYESENEQVSADESHLESAAEDNKIDEVVILGEKKQQDKNSKSKRKREGINHETKSIKYTVFCCKCAGKHNSSECTKKKRENAIESMRDSIQLNLYNREKEWNRNENRNRNSGTKKYKDLGYKPEIFSDEESDDHLQKKRYREYDDESDDYNEKSYRKNHNNNRRNDSPNNMMFNSFVSNERNYYKGGNGNYQQNNRNFRQNGYNNNSSYYGQSQNKGGYNSYNSRHNDYQRVSYYEGGNTRKFTKH